MNIIKPNKLKKGDTIAIIAPAGNVEKDKILNSVRYFENLGYKIKLGKNIFNQDRYLAGTDEERLSDLHEAFEDNEVKAIFCARGGYGSIRLINRIDYELIRNNPKIFCGYSDITALSLMFLKKSGLITYSAPMPKGDFQPEDIDKFTEYNFWNALTNNSLTVATPNLKTYKGGDAQGILWGGNLATICSLCGLDFIPDEKFIFFAEDLNEPVYKLDRSFRQLLNIDKFSQNVAAVILGDFLRVGEYKDQLAKLFNELAQELNVPVYGGYPITHDKSKITVPVGAIGQLNCGVLEIRY
jgi:muramoyltetrapeptide carboxypeptidase